MVLSQTVTWMTTACKVLPLRTKFKRSATKRPSFDSLTIFWLTDHLWTLLTSHGFAWYILGILARPLAYLDATSKGWAIDCLVNRMECQGRGRSSLLSPSSKKLWNLKAKVHGSSCLPSNLCKQRVCLHMTPQRPLDKENYWFESTISPPMIDQTTNGGFHSKPKRKNFAVNLIFGTCARIHITRNQPAQ